MNIPGCSQAQSGGPFLSTPGEAPEQGAFAALMLGAVEEVAAVCVTPAAPACLQESLRLQVLQTATPPPAEQPQVTPAASSTERAKSVEPSAQPMATSTAQPLIQTAATDEQEPPQEIQPQPTSPRLTTARVQAPPARAARAVLVHDRPQIPIEPAPVEAPVKAEVLPIEADLTEETPDQTVPPKEASIQPLPAASPSFQTEASVATPQLLPTLAQKAVAEEPVTSRRAPVAPTEKTPVEAADNSRSVQPKEAEPVFEAATRRPRRVMALSESPASRPLAPEPPPASDARLQAGGPAPVQPEVSLQPVPGPLVGQLPQIVIEPATASSPPPVKKLEIKGFVQPEPSSQSQPVVGPWSNQPPQTDDSPGPLAEPDEAHPTPIASLDLIADAPPQPLPLPNQGPRLASARPEAEFTPPTYKEAPPSNPAPVSPSARLAEVIPLLAYERPVQARPAREKPPELLISAPTARRFPTPNAEPLRSDPSRSPSMQLISTGELGRSPGLEQRLQQPLPAAEVVAKVVVGNFQQPERPPSESPLPFLPPQLATLAENLLRQQGPVNHPLHQEILQRLQAGQPPAQPVPAASSLATATASPILPDSSLVLAQAEKLYSDGEKSQPDQPPAASDQPEFVPLCPAETQPQANSEKPLERSQGAPRPTPDATEHVQRLARQQGQALLEMPREVEMHVRSERLGDVAAHLKVNPGGSWTAHLEVRDAKVEHSLRQELGQISESRGLEGFSTSLSQDSRDHHGSSQGFSFDQNHQPRSSFGRGDLDRRQRTYQGKNSPQASTSGDLLPIEKASSVHGTHASGGLNVRA
ncbi:MAG: hypothetical protein U0931_26430 [Vulcanimicrobiota bacterium]